MPLCKDTRELILELGTLSPKIKTKVYDFVKNGDEDLKYNIKRIPAIAIIGNKDYGIRYYGMPTGYEFPVIVDDIMSQGVPPPCQIVSRRDFQK